MVALKERWISSSPIIVCKNLGYQELASYKAQLNCFRIMVKVLCTEAVRFVGKDDDDHKRNDIQLFFFPVYHFVDLIWQNYIHRS